MNSSINFILCNASFKRKWNLTCVGAHPNDTSVFRGPYIHSRVLHTRAMETAQNELCCFLSSLPDTHTSFPQIGKQGLNRIDGLSYLSISLCDITFGVRGWLRITCKCKSTDASEEEKLMASLLVNGLSRLVGHPGYLQGICVCAHDMCVHLCIYVYVCSRVCICVHVQMCVCV